MKLLNLCVYGGIGIIALIGVFLLINGGRNLWYGLTSRHWPSVSGTVTKSAASADTTLDRETSIERTFCRADLIIVYQVAGCAYQTDQIHIGQTMSSGDASEAELRCLRYPVGMTVRIFYKPDAPRIGVIRPGFHVDQLWLPGAALAFLLPAIMFLLLFLYVNSKPNLLSVGLGLFAMIFMLIGLMLTLVGGIRLWRAHQSMRWPLTVGEIIYSQKDHNTTSTTNDDGETVISTSYATDLIYRYEVDDVRYYSSNRRFGQLAGAGQKWADEIAGQYPVGKKVKVYYASFDPDLAVLEPGFGSEAYWLPGVGLAFLLFGLAVWIWGIPALTGKG